MKNYLEIKSFGEIDVEAFTLIGASTKREDETKIGIYGSGNKYAIASLFNQCIDFRVFSGEDEILFTTKKQTFRGQEFDVILVNGVSTSLTTTMGGEDWGNAFAPIREIYSNALDEDEDATLKNVNESDILTEKGYTKFYIEMTKDVHHFYKNLHLYFCNANPKVLYSGSFGSIFENTDEGIRVFRKGILAHSDKINNALFYYNSKNIEINESRVVKSISNVEVNLVQILKTCTNSNIIEQIILGMSGGNKGWFEHTFYWDSWTYFSEVWLEVCKDKKFAPVEYTAMFSESDLKNTYLLPLKILKPLKNQFPELNILGVGAKTDEIYSITQPNEILIDKVISAIEILNKTRYRHRFTNPIIEYVKFSSDTILGLAENDKIFLSVKLDSHDVSSIAKILIEENEHNRTGYGDKTRVFQDHLFSLYFDELIK